MTENKRGGAGRGQGRKPIKDWQDTVTVSLRMTAAQRDKLALLGGAKWVRQRIDKAKAPNVQIEPPPRLFAEVGSNAGLGGIVKTGEDDGKRKPD